MCQCWQILSEMNLELQIHIDIYVKNIKSNSETLILIKLVYEGYVF